MKKLLITASTFPRYVGDTEPRFIYDLAKSLLPYYDVTVLVPGAPNALKEENMNGVKVIRYTYFPIKALQTLCYPGAIVPRIKEKKVRGLLVPFLFTAMYIKLFRIRKDYDVIHSNWIIPQGIVQGMFGNKSKSTPYVVTGHGADVTSLNKGIIRGLKRKCIKNASYVTVVSQHLKNKVNDIYVNNNISVIPMGCNTKAFGKKYRQEQYFNQKACKVILFAGRLAEKKGVRYLIEASEYIRENIKIIIAGDGPLKEELASLADKYNSKYGGNCSKEPKNRLYERSIELIGPKTHDELKVIYASADIFAAPSVTAGDGDQEGFGLTILEAMASGLPVIASDSGGIGDLVKDGVNGLLTKERNPKDIADKINRLLKDSRLAKELVSNALETAKRYDYDEIGKKYASIFDEIVKN